MSKYFRAPINFAHVIIAIYSHFQNMLLIWLYQQEINGSIVQSKV